MFDFLRRGGRTGNVGRDARDPVVRVEGLRKVYGSGDNRVVVLDDVSVGFLPGQFTAVMGPSGSGKSTLMNCLVGLDRPDRGDVYIRDIKVSELDEAQLTRLRRDAVGFVFQDFNLVPTLTAQENITLAQDLAGRRPDQQWLGMIIDLLGLRDRLAHKPAELSGGQQQRVACARALAGRPAIVLADEPTGNVDSRTSAQLLSFLRRSVREMGQTIVMVTHDPVAASYSDRVLFLADGRIVHEMLEPTAQRVLEWLKRIDTTPRAVRQVAAARADQLCKVYGSGEARVAALDRVSVGFPSRQFTAIMGPSGSGKSTLMHCLAGLDRASEGHVYIGDVRLSDLNDAQLTRLRRDVVGFVFQDFNLLPALTALENITYPLRVARRRPDKEWLDTIVDMLGLRDRLAHKPAQLSGGQQQRVACARALAGRPEIIFADEPTGNLDSRSAGDVLRFLRWSVHNLEQTIVMVTHDAVAASYSDRVLFLADGRIVDEMLKPTADRVLERMMRFDSSPAAVGQGW